jgi:hypothetical protein
LAWKLATPAKQHIARKLKKIWDVWNIMVGLDTIICSGQTGQYKVARIVKKKAMNIKPENPYQWQ